MTGIAIEIERFEPSGDEPLRWRINQTGAGWRVTGPDGAVAEAVGGLVDALRDSGACGYSAGSALRIQTGGTVDPFALFPALEEWLEESPATSESGTTSGEAPAWWWHPDFARLDEVAADDYESLFLDSSRIILIDDDLCGVCSALIGNGPSAIRKRIFVLAEWELMGDLAPKFFDLWATMSIDNGYGWGRHSIGEVVPGVRAVVDNHEGMRYITFDPLPSSDELYGEVLAWISGCVSSTPNPGTDEGFSQFEVVVDGNDVQIVCPDDGPHVDASGWIAPAVIARRPLP